MVAIPGLSGFVMPNVGSPPGWRERVPVSVSDDGKKAHVLCRCRGGCQGKHLAVVRLDQEEEPNFLFSIFCEECERITVLKMFRPAEGHPRAEYYRGQVEADDRRLDE